MEKRTKSETGGVMPSPSDGISLRAFTGALAIDIFDHYTKTEDADATIRKLLEMTGKALGVSRALIFETGEEPESVKLTYSWAADDPCGVMEQDLKYDYGVWSVVLPVMDEDGFAAVEDCLHEPLVEPYWDYCRENATVSSMNCYYFRAGEPVGSVYVDSDKYPPRHWTDDEKDLMKTVAKIFSTYLYNMRQMQRLQKEQLLLHAIDKNQDSFTYILKDGTHEILYLSDNIKDRMPFAKPGDTCYRVFQKSSAPCENCPLSSPDSNRAEFFSTSLQTWVTSSATRIRLADGEPATLICVSDIAGFKARIDGLDALTGIPTLPMFRGQAEAELRGSTDSFALCYLDFDDFGAVNDKKGIAAADQMLKDFAAFIRSRLLPGELVCRYFSDVFIVLARADTGADARIRARELYISLSEWAASYFSGLRLLLKCGACVADHDGDLDAMISHAITAKEALGGSTGGYALFNAQMRDLTERRMALEADLEGALKTGEFSVYFQPRIHLKTGTVAGAEAFLRWRRKGGQMVPPGEFLPLLEKNGLARQTDIWIAERVLRSIQAWRSATGDVIPVTATVSEASLRDPAFVEYISGLLRESDLPRCTLGFILQDTMFAKETEQIAVNIRALRKSGAAFLIDDLGRGPSRLDVVRDLPVDMLKIDNDFFGHVHLSERERATLGHIIRMAKSMDMQVVLTGITTEDQVAMLQNADGDFGQGPLYGPPMKAEDFQKLLENGIQSTF